MKAPESYVKSGFCWISDAFNRIVNSVRNSPIWQIWRRSDEKFQAFLILIRLYQNLECTTKQTYLSPNEKTFQGVTVHES